jgi:AraC-like DNA-binding protein
MEVQFYKPANEVLRQYIEGFYFVEKKKIGAPVRYWTFPNNYCIAAVYQNTHLLLDKNRIEVTVSGKTNIDSSLVSRYIRPIEIVQHDITDEITIYFKPLGLNQFVPNIQLFFNDDIKVFNPFPDYKAAMNKIFNTVDREMQIRQLEAYWLSKLAVKDLSFIQQIIDDLQGGLRIHAIAEKHNISRQYLNKIFVFHTGKSPSEFHKIYRFRNSITEKGKARSLTDLSYQSLFYDQSHFIKNFKDFTGLIPSDFFAKVDTAKDNVWFVL